MNILNFLDANVWLALVWGRHVHSEKARAWYERSADEQFLFCRLTQMTVLRLLTTEAVLGQDVRSMAQAWELWDNVTSDPHIAFLPEPENLEIEFRNMTVSDGKSPKLWSDAYLLAFVRVAGLKLVTFDQALQTRKVDVLLL